MINITYQFVGNQKKMQHKTLHFYITKLYNVNKKFLNRCLNYFVFLPQVMSHKNRKLCERKSSIFENNIFKLAGDNLSLHS